MTTQAPNEQPGAYPTAPPWAPPRPAPQPTAPWGAVPQQHGRLMVPYPEEMFHADRPVPPSWIPVVLLTFFLWPFGLVSAARRAAKARQGRNDRHPYWIAFGATTAAGAVLLGAAVAIGVPLLLAARENAATSALESNLVHDGQISSASSATCRPVGARGDEDLRDYSCTVTLTNGRSGTIAVTADRNGHWQITA